MKKIILLVFIASSFASCKKDRVCTCTNQDGSISSQATYINVTKKEARNLCTTTLTGVTCSVK